MKSFLLPLILCFLIFSCGGGGSSDTPSTISTPETQTPTPTVSPPSSPTPPTEGRVFYVSPNGSNSNPGTREAPWQTPGYGSRQLRPGDTLVILGGRYVLSRYDEDIIRPPSGTSTAWITIRGEPANRPILVGRNNLIHAINLSGSNYVKIENLEITSDSNASGSSRWFRNGIEIIGDPASNIVLQDLYIHHLDEFGINIQDVDNLQIINSRIEYCGFGAVGGPEAQRGGWRNVLIRRCSLSWSGHYYQGGDGSNRPYSRPDGLGIEPSSGPLIIEDSIVQNNLGDGLDSKAANTIIRRTIVANNACDGVKLWAGGSRVENTLIYGRGGGNPTPTPWAPIVIDQVTQAGARFEIVNVTVDDYLGQNYLMYVQYDNPVPVEVIIRNSIFSGRSTNPGPIYIGRTSRVNVSHTLFYIPNSTTIITHGTNTYTCNNIRDLGPNNFCADPLFVNPAWGTIGDYRLRQGSPAINAGTTLGAPNEDINNTPRDTNPDLGAYEFR